MAKCETTDLKHALPSGQPRHPASYAANRELYHMEDAAKPITDHSEMTKDVVPENHCCRKLENSMQAVQDTKLQETTEVTASEDKPKQSRYTRCSTKANGKTLCTKKVLQHTISTLESSR